MAFYRPRSDQALKQVSLFDEQTLQWSKENDQDLLNENH